MLPLEFGGPAVARVFESVTLAFQGSVIPVFKLHC